MLRVPVRVCGLHQRNASAGRTVPKVRALAAGDAALSWRVIFLAADPCCLAGATRTRAAAVSVAADLVITRSGRLGLVLLLAPPFVPPPFVQHNSRRRLAHARLRDCECSAASCLLRLLLKPQP